jgi:predicted transcriptional regulator
VTVEQLDGQRYLISELLANGEQPWSPLDADTYDALREQIYVSNGRLVVPVVLSARGRLIDGHHRLQIVQEFGRTTIDAEEVRTDVNAVDPESEALAALRHQRLRRQTGTADNAKVARDLMRRFGWSQGLVAFKMGVSAAAVSQWLKAHPDPTFELRERTGRDGRTIDVSGITDPPTGKAVRDKAKPSIAVTRTINRYETELTNPELAQWTLAHVDDDDREFVALALDNIARAATSMAESMRALTEPMLGF